MAGFLARYGNGVLDSVAAHIASWYSHALEADRGPPRLVAMAYLGIVLLIVLLIPIFAILTDSPLGRAALPAGWKGTPRLHRPRRARETGRASGERARGRHPESRNAPGGAPVLPAPPRGRRSPATAAVHPGILNPFRQGGAPLVAAGIFLNRLAGLVRQRVLSHYLGLSLPADAFNRAFRIPNFLQNLFGEGVLSRRSSPPTRGCGPKERTRRRAASRGVLGILSVAVAVLVALGITTAPWLVTILAPGFHGAKRDLTIELVRILFPGIGLWCCPPGAQHPQQPPQILPLLFGAGPLELRHHSQR